jgi:hypothetical protein
MGLLQQNTFTVTIKREDSNTSAGGASNVTYTTAQRIADGLAITGTCRLMEADGAERLMYNQDDVWKTGTALFETDPELDNRDVLTVDGRTLFVDSCLNIQSLSRLWIASWHESSRSVK